jgi:uncharacterized protein (TIGR04222 family)
VALVVLGARLLLRQLEDATMPRIDLGDPYLIAYLRGGARGTLGVAVTSLIDRGLLLLHENGRVQARDDEVEKLVRRPIERDVIRAAKQPTPFAGLAEDGEVDAALQSYQRELARLKLLPDSSVRVVRSFIAALGVFLVMGAAVAKLSVAASRGKHNVGFLMIFSVLACAAVAWTIVRRRTRLGDRLLEDIRVLFQPLRVRAPTLVSGGATSEAALVSSAFGLGVLPAWSFPQAHQFERQTAWYRASRDGSSWSTSSDSSSWSSCGSSSSSCSSGSSCGSSCGGGGGCGGCGS